MPETSPRVTVVIPTWNWSEVLPFSIGSALLQTFGDFELLVVGDGCTDDSAAVVARVGDSRVRWINLPANTGHQSGPNNEGLRQAQGEIVAYLGHDDLWLPHHLACLVQAIDAGADLAYAMVRMVSPADGDERCIVVTDYRPGVWLPPTSVVHRRALVESAGGWPDYRELAIDPEAELWRRFHAAGAAITFVPRLTAVKLPAAHRRDVYRERPFHEQAAWLERIRSSDVEAEELAALLIDTRARSGSLGTHVRAAVSRRTMRLLARLRPPEPPLAAGEAVERRRVYKGLDSVGTYAAGAPPAPGEEQKR